MYSFSQLQQFVQCELRYAYRYVLKYPEPKTTSLALIL
ncbi:MAG: PD-(D/E)XK nuclease family protein [Candidatus Peribacteria bacterium]|nr:MAG: PD-(D/E)XK nuclease family protein [Candidatus Peribacteria bacterium]